MSAGAPTSHDARPPPLVLVCSKRPHSSNLGTSKESYKEFSSALEGAFVAAGRPRLSGLLYGIVYWFVRGYKSRISDADNISKTVWDMLKTPTRDTKEHELRLCAYVDDKQVRLRVAGIIDISVASTAASIMEQLTLSPMSKQAATELENFIEDPGTQHLTYVECGPLRSDMFGACLIGGLL